jgi:hypothetical protein
MLRQASVVILVFFILGLLAYLFPPAALLIIAAALLIWVFSNLKSSAFRRKTLTVGLYLVGACLLGVIVFLAPIIGGSLSVVATVAIIFRWIVKARERSLAESRQVQTEFERFSRCLSGGHAWEATFTRAQPGVRQNPTQIFRCRKCGKISNRDPGLF